MAFDFELARFLPAEAETITGVSTALQRDWRRHGYLPSQKGRASFDVFFLARMMFLSTMSASGFGPAHAINHADAVMNQIAWGALSTTGAMIGVPCTPDHVIANASPIGETFRDAAKAPLFVIWANSVAMITTFTDSVDSLIRGARDAGARDKLSVPLIAMDTIVMGEVLAQRAGRPLVRVIEVPEG